MSESEEQAREDLYWMLRQLVPQEPEEKLRDLANRLHTYLKTELENAEDPRAWLEELKEWMMQKVEEGIIRSIIESN